MAMTDDSSASPSDLPPRLQDFQDEVTKLGVTGGGANPEKTGARIGIALFVIAVAIEIGAYFAATSASDARDQNELIILALLGVVLALGGVGLYLRNSMTRWFRYWLVRLVYEDRASTDRIVDAIERNR